MFAACHQTGSVGQQHCQSPVAQLYLGRQPAALPRSLQQRHSRTPCRHSSGRRSDRCVVMATAVTAPPAQSPEQVAEELATGVSSTPEWKALAAHRADIEKTHLRDLLQDNKRADLLYREHVSEHGTLIADFSRQRVTDETLRLLIDLANKVDMRGKIDKMFSGVHINTTEDRSVLHAALRAPRDATIMADGKNVVPDVWDTLDKIKGFSEKVRNGEWKGATGQNIQNVVAIGIGGSFLGPLFVHTALRTDQNSANESKGRTLRFLANVDPVDVARALNGLDPATTMAVVVSKTFTTAETMLNARTVGSWLKAELGEGAVSKHMVAVSTNLKLVKEFGIDPENAFGFWDWVGGRYSVTSAVGILPLALQYGFDTCEQFLKGAHDIDEHFRTAPFEENLPVLMGLLGVWNISFLGYPCRAILPYAQALSKLAPHIQQVSMESNGKGVSIDGKALPFEAGQIDFGEPGTNGQHSFYQLIHQGRVIPCDFIGLVKSQQSVYLKGEVVSNHDELMSNFFAQADALALGKTPIELRSENVRFRFNGRKSENPDRTVPMTTSLKAQVPDALIPHKTFTGNRPSSSIMLPDLSAYTTGQILALYEHVTAAMGFVWGINSFDQWGVELGKVLASKVRTTINACRTKHRSVSPQDGFNYSTTRLMAKYLEGKAQLLYPEPADVFPCDLIDADHCRPPTSYI